MDSRRVVLTSAGFKDAGYAELALEISRAGVMHNPRSYTLWKQIYDNLKNSVQLGRQAEISLKEIDLRFVNIP